MPSFCSVINCSMKGNRDPVSFYRFPAALQNVGDYLKVISKKRREMWIRALKRGPLSESQLRNGRVCSRHFISGAPALLEDEESPDWVPSQNMGYFYPGLGKAVGVKRHKRLAKHQRRKELKQSSLYGLCQDTQDTEVFENHEIVDEQLKEEDLSITENDWSDISSKEQGNMPFSAAPTKQLEFVTVVEEVDESSTDSIEHQDFFTNGVKKGTTPLVLHKRPKTNGSTLPYVFSNTISSQKLAMPPLVLLPVAGTNPKFSTNHIHKTPVPEKIIKSENSINVGTSKLREALCGNRVQPYVTASNSSPKQTTFSEKSTTVQHSDKEIDFSSQFEVHSSSSEGTEELKQSLRKKGKNKRKPLPRYFGDITADDMDCPSRARVCLTVAQRTVSNLKTTVRTLRNQNRLLNQKVDSMKKLYEYLEENNFLNEYAKAAIKAVLPEEADSFSPSKHTEMEHSS